MAVKELGVITFGVVLLAIFAGTGIPGNGFTSTVTDLWVKTKGRVRDEIDYNKKHTLSGSVQSTDNHITVTVDANDDTSNVLTLEKLVEEKHVLETINKLSVNVTVGIGADRKERTFYTDDVCYALGPSPYQFQCLRVTALDCFKDGQVDMPPAHKAYLDALVYQQVPGLVKSSIRKSVECKSISTNPLPCGPEPPATCSGDIITVGNRAQTGGTCPDTKQLWTPKQAQCVPAPPPAQAKNPQVLAIQVVTSQVDSTVDGGCSCGCNHDQKGEALFKVAMALGLQAQQKDYLTEVVRSKNPSNPTSVRVEAKTSLGKALKQVVQSMAICSDNTDNAAYWDSCENDAKGYFKANATAYLTSLQSTITWYTNALHQTEVLYEKTMAGVTDALAARAQGLATLALSTAAGMSTSYATQVDACDQPAINAKATALANTMVIQSSSNPDGSPNSTGLADFILSQGESAARAAEDAKAILAGVTTLYASGTCPGRSKEAIPGTELSTLYAVNGSQPSNAAKVGTLIAVAMTNAIKAMGGETYTQLATNAAFGNNTAKIVLGAAFHKAVHPAEWFASAEACKTKNPANPPDAIYYWDTCKPKVESEANYTSFREKVTALTAKAFDDATKFGETRTATIDSVKQAAGYSTSPSPDLSGNRAKLKDTLSAAISGQTAKWAKDEATLNMAIGPVGAMTAATMFYGARLPLGGATQEQINGAVSGFCRFWDDPTAPLFYAPLKQLSFGGVKWCENAHATGFDAVAKMDTTNPRGRLANGDTTSELKPKDGTSLLASANAVSQIHRTISAYALQNRLKGLKPDGTPLTATVYKWTPQGITEGLPWKESLTGKNVVNRFSTRSTKGGDGAIDVTLEDAQAILRAWETKFQDELGNIVNKNGPNSRTTTYSYTAHALSEHIKKHGKPDGPMAAVGYICMLIFILVLLTYAGDIRIALASMFGACLVGVALVGGFGLSALMGVNFNAPAVQVLPFLMLGIGVNDMFVVAFTAIQSQKGATRETWMPMTMQKAGLSITATSMCNFFIFLIGHATQIPVVIEFTSIAAVTTVLMWACNRFMFPALLSFAWTDSRADAIDTSASKCAFLRPDKIMSNVSVRLIMVALMCIVFAVGAAGVPKMELGLQANDVAKAGSRLHKALGYRTGRFPTLPGTVYTRSFDFAKPQKQLEYQHTAEMVTKIGRKEGETKILEPNKIWTTPFFTWLQPSLAPPTAAGLPQMWGTPDATAVSKACATSNPLTGGECGPKHGCTLGWVPAGINGVPKLSTTPGGSDGLDFKDYSAATACNGTDYKFSNGLNTFPLCKKVKKGYGSMENHTEWCMALPETEIMTVNNDADRQEQLKTQNFWPLAKTKSFRDCMELWYDNDDSEQLWSPKLSQQLAWNESVKDGGLNGANATKVGAGIGVSGIAWEGPEGAKVSGSSFGFYATNLVDDAAYIATIKDVRNVLEQQSTTKGNYFPKGVPFDLWEQYVTLKQDVVQWVSIEYVVGFVVMALVLAFSADGNMVSAVVKAIWSSLLNLVVCVCVTVELYGFLAWAKIKLSAIPAITIWMSAAVSVEFTAHIVVAYSGAAGDTRWARVMKAFDSMFLPTMAGAISTLIGVLPLAGVDFPFIKKYYLVPYVLIVVLATVNAFILLPALLSLVGAPGSSQDAPQTKAVGKAPGTDAKTQGSTVVPVRADAVEAVDH